MTILAPRSGAELKAMLDWAVEQGGPVAIRYPRGSSESKCPDEPSAPMEAGIPEVIREGGDIAIVALGPMLDTALEAAERLAEGGVEAAVVNARFAKPLDERFYVDLAERTGRVITIEDGVVTGGFGSAVVDLILKAIPEKAGGVIKLGFPSKFIEHGPRPTLMRKYGLNADGIVDAAGKLLGTKIETRSRED
jgi:1-deoxy-D-xylulose-5-phosphate synthase